MAIEGIHYRVRSYDRAGNMAMVPGLPVTPGLQIPLGHPRRQPGINYACWSSNCYDRGNAAQALELLPRDCVSWASVAVSRFQDTATSMRPL